MKSHLATFAAGCFWHVEEVFRTVNGVLKTTVGYTGGETINPSYKEVCNGTTGHAEAVQLEFNPEIISYQKLLDVFWDVHDPSTLNRQGHDIGTQYRSAIFYHTEEQKQQALESKTQQQKKYVKPIVTEIIAASTFYPAEEYHQNYLMKRGAKTCGI